MADKEETTKQLEKRITKLEAAVKELLEMNITNNLYGVRSGLVRMVAEPSGAETELEQKAWELYRTDSNRLVEEVFHTAEYFLAERARMRKEKKNGL